jgi:hypothetical protein
MRVIWSHVWKHCTMGPQLLHIEKCVKDSDKSCREAAGITYLSWHFPNSGDHRICTSFCKAHGTRPSRENAALCCSVAVMQRTDLLWVFCVSDRKLGVLKVAAPTWLLWRLRCLKEAKRRLVRIRKAGRLAAPPSTSSWPQPAPCGLSSELCGGPDRGQTWGGGCVCEQGLRTGPPLQAQARVRLRALRVP